MKNIKVIISVMIIVAIFGSTALTGVDTVKTVNVTNVTNEEVSTEESIIIETNDTVKTKKAKKKKKYKKIGTFKITGYCACSSCCGKSNGITASGTKAKAGRTIAADTSKYPFGTKLKINGKVYTVEDRGGAINGDKIDIYFNSHSEALQWGVRYSTVYKKTTKK